MLEYGIIEATTKKDLQEQFRKFIEDHPKTSLYGVQTHIVTTLTGIKFFISFMYAKQSNLMVGQQGGMA